MDTVSISGLEFTCIVGVRPFERRRPQRVRLSIGLELDLSRAGVTDRIGNTVDYSVVADEVAHLLQFREYRLVETATEELAAMLLAVHRGAERVHVTLEKPEALRGRAACGAVSITRERRTTVRSVRGFGEEELLLETADARLSLLHVAPERSLGELGASSERRLAWLVNGQLGNPPLAPYEPRELARLFTAVNRGPEAASVFVCSVSAASAR